MDPLQPADAAERLAAAIKAQQQQTLVLRLYVAGASHRSTEAITTLMDVLERHFAGSYKLEVLDVYQHTEQAHIDNILATPTLLVLVPAVGRYFVGDMQATDRLFAALGIKRNRPE